MVNTDIFLGSGTSVTKVPEVDIYLGTMANFTFTADGADTELTLTSLNKDPRHLLALTTECAGLSVTGTSIGSANSIASIDSATQITLGVANTGAISGGTITVAPDLTDVDTILLDEDFSDNFSLVENLYIGCILKRYNAGGNLLTRHRITGNTDNTITFTPNIATVATDDQFVIDSYGAPCPAPRTADTVKALLADQWLGIAETVTFPTTEVEMKQTNLSLGGSRNWTYQYKGIETSSGGTLALVANHGAWLYYFFGKCTSITANNPAATTPTSFATGASGDNNKLLINTGGVSHASDEVAFTTTPDNGPIAHRTIGAVVVPPINATENTLAHMETLTVPTQTGTTIIKPIVYTFAEEEGDLLPSFAMEQVFSKLPTSNTYRTSGNTDEDLNFVKIARGNRVNELSMTANANEEVKMSLTLNTRTVSTPPSTDTYDARRGITDETAFFNFSSVDGFREPFFFSDGTFSIFGNNFLKIETVTLTMSNSLADKRFLGVGSKSIQEAIPAQRTYEVQFTGLVTDSKLYNELLNQSENDGDGNDGGSDYESLLELTFTKSNGENIVLKFKDYFLTANNFPIAEDKGPTVVEATVTPRSLHECTVKTHWVLQG